MDSPDVEAPAAEPEVAPEPPELPGRRLREAREARGFSVADVAQALKFSPRQIEALESGDLSALPGSTFVRGFVRSYARFLKQDAESLLAMIETQVPPVLSDVRAPQSMGSADPTPMVRQIPLLVAASVILLVAATVVGVWHFLDRPGAPDAKDDVRPAGPAQAPAPVPPPRVEQAAAADAGAVVKAAAPDALSTDGRRLAFETQDKSWIEVRDAGQQILFSGEVLPGGRQVVKGRLPLHLVIGNASKVGLSLDGHPVDLAPHIRADVARLTIE